MPPESQTSIFGSLQLLVLLRYLVPALLFLFVLSVLRVMATDASRLRGDVSATRERGGLAELVVVQGTSPAVGERFQLVSESVIIGRDPTVEVTITDGFASSRHAQVVRQGDRYYLADLGSTNGTLVNGQAVTDSVFLVEGDDIEIGEVVFRFGFCREAHT